MTDFHVVTPPRRLGTLQAHDFLMLLHQAKCHTDSSRQRGRRQQSKDRRVARRLKSQHVPLCFVDPTVYLSYEDWDGRTCWRHDVTPTRVVEGVRVYSWTRFKEVVYDRQRTA